MGWSGMSWSGRSWFALGLQLVLTSVAYAAAADTAALLRMGSAAAQPNQSVPRMPASRLVLWAWTRSENLSFVRPDEFEVAYLAGEILVRPGRVLVNPRRRPLRLPAGVTRIAVVYLDVARRVRAPLNDQDIALLARRVLSMPLVRDAERLQLNFEGAASRVPDWRRLMRALRVQMRASQTLETSVLASWCMDASFVAPQATRLVPMLFRLGSVDPPLQRVLRGVSAFPAAACRGSAGVALDELDLVSREFMAAVPVLYVFSGAPWSPAALRALRAWHSTP